MPLEVPEGYQELDAKTIAFYLAGEPALVERLGGDATDWRINEVGDGNLNLVFIVEGPNGSLCLKQALPYVRLVGESWPLPVERAFFEHEALTIEGDAAPGLVPEIYHYDPELFLIVMERLQPHIIMRRGMIDAIEYPAFAEHAAEFCAKTLFATSDLGLPAGEKKLRMATFCANTELCRITEQLIFTEPYMVADNNRWTTPHLDAAAAAIRSDGTLKRAISKLKVKFLSEAQALVHGDLHTGSIMVTQTDTRVIDPEFAFFGPIGFDVGKLIGNLLLNYFSQDGHAEQTGTSRDDYQAWVLDVIEVFWTSFVERFLGHWDEHHAGDAWPAALFEGEPESLVQAQREVMDQLFTDVLGFGAAAMIRRTLGLAHNIDFEWIEDPAQRALCERRNLTLARELMVEPHSFGTIAAVTAAARRVRAKPSSSLIGA